MTKTHATKLSKSAIRLLCALAADHRPRMGPHAKNMASEAAALMAADLARQGGSGELQITNAGRAYLARAAAARNDQGVDGFRAQHLDLTERTVETSTGPARVMANEAESPLAWLARRKGRDGRALIEAHQFQAGERLRADFTRAHLTPRITANWQAPIARDRRAGDFGAPMTDIVVAARQSVTRALDSVGPEFSGLLLDVCCFLKGLTDIEAERSWPPRSAKVVLQLALDRLARHYGYAAQARGKNRAPLRAWSAAGGDIAAENG